MDDDIKELREELASVSLIAHAMATEREKKRVRKRNLVIAILAILFVLSNLCWAFYATRFERVEEEFTETVIEGVDQYADGGGNNTVVGGDFVNGDAAKN